MTVRCGSPSSCAALVIAAASAMGCSSGRPAADAPVYRVAPTQKDAAGPVVPPVYVHLDGNDSAVLDRATDDPATDGWVTVCRFPCDGYVPAFGRYRVVLCNGHPGQPFTLPGPPGTWVVLQVDDDGRLWTRSSVAIDAGRGRHW